MEDSSSSREEVDKRGGGWGRSRSIRGSSRRDRGCTMGLWVGVQVPVMGSSSSSHREEKDKVYHQATTKR